VIPWGRVLLPREGKGNDSEYLQGEIIATKSVCYLKSRAVFSVFDKNTHNCRPREMQGKSKQRESIATVKVFKFELEHPSCWQYPQPSNHSLPTTVESVMATLKAGPGDPARIVFTAAFTLPQLFLLLPSYDFVPFEQGHSGRVIKFELEHPRWVDGSPCVGWCDRHRSHD
jgi:hypothetical protein